MAKAEYWPRYGIENYSFVFPFEHTFDPISSTEWMQRNWHNSIYSSLLYGALILTGRKVGIMESRKALSLDTPLFVWNLCLAIFSITGVIRMSPEMWWSITSNSLEYSICTASYAQGVTGFWTEKFAMSKILEFGDTAFIVLRKRPLSFLHWYHHVTVLCYTWHAYKDHTASGRWFIWMNYTVHAFMYSYYALRSLRFKLPKSAAMMVTVLQILQMIGGVTIGISILRIKLAGRECQQTWNNLYFSFLIYFSYFLLFCNFFYETYLKEVSYNLYCTNTNNDSNNNSVVIK
uniref:Elongation of very long chain fatty acids protein n=1 Tax=Syphacia muris TaxID=451379 RepID=A0A0N5AHR6_9BILA